MTTSTSAHHDVLIRARGLTKHFSGRTAVDHVDFDVHAGESVGFLGPNGAGKTTTIRMLLNILNPSEGSLVLFGETFSANRGKILRQMNASSGSLTLPGKLSVVENLRVIADLYGLKRAEQRIDQMIQRFDLTELRDRGLYTLSTGQQVRVALAKSFLNRPRLLLLDEPTASLDPDVADRVRAVLMEAVKEEGTTLFLTSHNMAEVERVCTRVIFLNEGRVQAEGSPKELARRVRRWTVRLRTGTALKELPPMKLPPDLSFSIDGKDVSVDTDRDHVGAFLTELARHGVDLEHVSIHEPTLEDFFVRLTRNETPHA